MPKVPEYNLPKFPPHRRPIPAMQSPKPKKGAKKKLARSLKHERLLRLFDGDGYEEFHTPKYVFVKQWNGNNKQWQVAIYPIESWRKKEKFNSETRWQGEHLRQIGLEE